MNELVIHLLSRLRDMPGFKMHCPNPGTFLIEAQGIAYDCSHYSTAEAIEDAYLYIASELRARELVKNAKVTL